MWNSIIICLSVVVNFLKVFRIVSQEPTALGSQTLPHALHTPHSYRIYLWCTKMQVSLSWPSPRITISSTAWSKEWTATCKHTLIISTVKNPNLHTDKMMILNKDDPGTWSLIHANQLEECPRDGWGRVTRYKLLLLLVNMHLLCADTIEQRIMPKSSKLVAAKDTWVAWVQEDTVKGVCLIS